MYEHFRVNILLIFFLNRNKYSIVLIKLIIQIISSLVIFEIEKNKLI